MHRGNNRQDIFESEEDITRIKEDIEHSLLKSGCSLHAYVIMTNHLHLLVTPKDKEQLTVFMRKRRFFPPRQFTPLTLKA